MHDEIIVIFDESHKCKNRKSVNSDLLFTLSHYSTPILMLSATACDKEEYFRIYGYVFGLYQSILLRNYEFITNIRIFLHSDIRNLIRTFVVIECPRITLTSKI